MTTTTNQRLRAAFHRLTLTLLGLFEIYQADAALVDHVAEELEALFHEHLGRNGEESRVRGKLALERLLDELEAAEPNDVNDGAERPMKGDPQ